MKNKLSILAIASLAFGAFSHADIIKQDYKTFKADGYTHSVDEVELTDWSNPDVPEWCTSVSNLRANCLRLMPTQAKEMLVEGKKYFAIPLRAHLFFKDNPWSGTVYYYGDVLVDIETGEKKVVLDPTKVVYSKLGEGVMAEFAGLDEPKDYVTKMQALLKKYFDQSADFKKLLETDTWVKFALDEMKRTGKIPTDK